MPDSVQIDPKTGERVQASSIQIDPATGERVSSTPDKPWLSSPDLTSTVYHQMPTSLSDLGKQVVTGVGNIGAAGLNFYHQVASDPLGVVTNVFRHSVPGMVLDASLNHGKTIYYDPSTGGGETPDTAKEAIKHPLETAEGLVGQFGAGDLAAEALPAMGRVAKRGGEILTGTSPSVLTKKGGIVPETQAANVDAAATADAANLKATEKAAKTNADIATKRAQELRDFHQDVSNVRAQNEAQSGTMSRKDALNRGVEHLDTVFKDDLGKLRDREADVANAKYTQLNAALDPVEANPEFLPDALDKAMEKIKGSDTEPTILKDMSKRVQRADEPLVYRDLQGYYSELGRELRRGTLPGDVYAAYDTLQEAIGNEMQNVADQNNLGPQLLDARQSWKNLKQTFYDPKSPVAKALKSTERGDAIKQFQGKDQTGIEAVAKYDPDLAARANTIRGYQAEAKGIRTTTKPPKAEPTLGPPTPPVTPDIVQPELQSITPTDIQQAKADALATRAQKIKTRGTGIVTTLAAYRGLADAFHGNFAALPSLFGESALGIGTTYTIGKILENPTVIEKLTRPTARDVAMIPPDLAKDMGPIVEAAKAKGLKVSPALVTAVSAASSSRWYNSDQQ